MSEREIVPKSGFIFSAICLCGFNVHGRINYTNYSCVFVGPCRESVIWDPYLLNWKKSTCGSYLLNAIPTLADGQVVSLHILLCGIHMLTRNRSWCSACEGSIMYTVSDKNWEFNVISPETELISSNYPARCLAIDKILIMVFIVWISARICPVNDNVDVSYCFTFVVSRSVPTQLSVW